MIVGFANGEVELPAAPKPKKTLDELQIRTLLFLNLPSFLIEEPGFDKLHKIRHFLKVGSK